MKIMKFGGSSVCDAERISTVCSIASDAAATDRIVLVCSAMKGVTDQLIASALLAEKGYEGWNTSIDDLRSRHSEAAGALLDEERRSRYVTDMEQLLGELTSILQGIYLVRECSPRSLDLVMSFGERLSCRLISDALRSLRAKSEYFDARDMIRTDTRYGNAAVNLEQSYIRIRRALADYEGIPVVPGFIAGSPEGAITTLGRNGSDYTASIIGAALDASVIEIWTDVDGVMSADPRYVINAFVLESISYEEAMELSFFGAEVLHPSTMIPAVERNIPIRIKNTLNPPAPGTVIGSDVKPSPHPITGIASIENVSLINIEGGGMLGMPGVASRVFKAIADAEVNIIMISQASSEHSICMVCRNAEASRAAKALERELKNEIESRTIAQIEVLKDLEIIAVIGENMRGKPGMSGRLFSSLGKAEINVLAIAQGSSERNISFIVDGNEREKALNTVHKAFLETSDGNG